MNCNEIKYHWEKLADIYGDNIHATTKTATIKRLEINCFYEKIMEIADRNHNKKNNTVLEVGCGNGINCIELAKQIPGIDISGIDYVEKMIDNAIESAGREKQDISFMVGDVTQLDANPHLKDTYDIIFSNRCLINLNTVELQKKAIGQISNKLTDYGYYLMLENSQNTYGNQNKLRCAVGLNERVPDAYNLFLDDREILSYANEKCRLKLLEIDNFASLHDIMQYILTPMLHSGKVDYGTELMEAVTEFLIKSSKLVRNQFGEFGQNRLYVFQKI